MPGLLPQLETVSIVVDTIQNDKHLLLLLLLQISNKSLMLNKKDFQIYFI